MNKEDNLKEKFKQALVSTVKVISEDFKLEKQTNKNLSSKNYNFFDLDNLNSREDYIKLRAETDSEALKRKFSNKETYEKNLPKNSSCKLLYDISEKIRYEMLGAKMLKGISKNMKDNYSNRILLKRKDQLKTKDDVKIQEAFELFMLKNFLGIKLNTLSEKILSYWEDDFKLSFEKHLSFLSKNIENQEVYNSKFSEILQEMEIFDSENDDEKQENKVIVIIGGGIAGCAVACELHRRGYTKNVFLLEKDESKSSRRQGYGLTISETNTAIEKMNVLNALKRENVSSKQHWTIDARNGDVLGYFGQLFREHLFARV